MAKRVKGEGESDGGRESESACVSELVEGGGLTRAHTRTKTKTHLRYLLYGGSIGRSLRS